MPEACYKLRSLPVYLLERRLPDWPSALCNVGCELGCELKGAILREELAQRRQQGGFSGPPPFTTALGDEVRAEHVSSCWKWAQAKTVGAKWHLLWFPLKRLVDPFITALSTATVPPSPVLLWCWQLPTARQHIPQPHSLRSSCARLNDKIDVAICSRTYEIPLLPLSFNIRFTLNQHPKGGSSSARENRFSSSSRRCLVMRGEICLHRVIDLMHATFRWDKRSPPHSSHPSVSSLSSLLKCVGSPSDTE